MTSDGGAPRRELGVGMRAQLDSESFVGVPTFGRRPLLTEPEQLDEWRPDAAIVGAPWDDNTTHRPGARFGPRALRAATYVNGSYHLDLELEIFDHLELVDYGDALVASGLWDVTYAAIHDRVAEVAGRGIIPLVIGGDHSITWPSATAVAEHHGFGNVGIIHFDAHADTANQVDGNWAKGRARRGRPRTCATGVMARAWLLRGLRAAPPIARGRAPTAPCSSSSVP